MSTVATLWSSFSAVVTIKNTASVDMVDDEASVYEIYLR